MGSEIKFEVGDLVTYREDLLGVQGYNGIVTNIFSDGYGVPYILVKWHDGEVYPELCRHIILLAKAKNDQ